jgi:hypothetical protein
MIDLDLDNLPIQITDLSQDGSTVAFRIDQSFFDGTVANLAVHYHHGVNDVDCGVYSNVEAEWSKTHNAVCFGGKADVKIYLHFCGETEGDDCDYCDTPSDNLDDFVEFSFELDCYEICEAAGPSSGPKSGPTYGPTSVPTGGPTLGPSVAATKTFTFKGNGKCKGVNGRVYNEAKARRINSADECAALCLEVDDTDLRGFSYKTLGKRCICLYDNNSEVIATCDRTYFNRCTRRRVGTGPVTSTTRRRQPWKCYSYD